MGLWRPPFSVVDHLRWDLHQIFKMAMSEGVIARNPATLLFTPREAPRPKQTALYARPVWLAEAILFAAGLELLVDGALAGSTSPARAGALLLVVSALVAAAGALVTLRRGLPALTAAAAGVVS